MRPADAPVLETARLMLRPLDAGDTNALHQAQTNPAYAGTCGTTSRDLIAHSNRTFSEEGVGLFGVRMRGREDLLGFCGFVRLEGIRSLNSCTS